MVALFWKSILDTTYHYYVIIKKCKVSLIFRLYSPHFNFHALEIPFIHILPALTGGADAYAENMKEKILGENPKSSAHLTLEIKEAFHSHVC
jgi:hypothetical protein